MADPGETLPPPPQNRCKGHGHGLLGHAQTPFGVVKPPRPQVVPGLPHNERKALENAFAWLRPLDHLRVGSSLGDPSLADDNVLPLLATTDVERAEKGDVEISPASPTTIGKDINKDSLRVSARTRQTVPEHEEHALMLALEHSDDEARYLAARALGQLGPDGHGKRVLALFQALKDPPANTWPVGSATEPCAGARNGWQTQRAGRAAVVGGIGLAYAPQDSGWQHRQAVAAALGQSGKGEVLPAAAALVAARRDRSPAVRHFADEALHDLDKRGASAVAELLRHGTPHEQTLAAKALGSLGLNAFPHEDALRDATQHEDVRVRTAAGTALESFGPTSPRWLGVSNVRAHSWSSTHGKQKRQMTVWSRPLRSRGGPQSSAPEGRHTGFCRHPAQRCTCRRINAAGNC